MKEILYALTIILRLNGATPEPQQFEVVIDGSSVEFTVEGRVGTKLKLELEPLTFDSKAACEHFGSKMKGVIEHSRAINYAPAWLGYAFGLNIAGAGVPALSVSYTCTQNEGPFLRPASQW